MTRQSFSLEEWTPTHPRWQELVHMMEAEEQAYYWQQEAYFVQFQHYFLIAVHANESVGFLQFFLQSIGPDRDCPPLSLHGKVLLEAKILAFAVRKEWRRQGIGTALQLQAISHARQLGCYQVRSYSSNTSEHEANYQLKLALGFAAQPEFRSEKNTGVNFLMPLHPTNDNDE
jgi:GNAT superfamily N-acetyltransferase